MDRVTDRTAPQAAIVWAWAWGGVLQGLADFSSDLAHLSEAGGLRHPRKRPTLSRSQCFAHPRPSTLDPSRPHARPTTCHTRHRPAQHISIPPALDSCIRPVTPSPSLSRALVAHGLRAAPFQAKPMSGNKTTALGGPGISFPPSPPVTPPWLDACTGSMPPAGEIAAVGPIIPPRAPAASAPGVRLGFPCMRSSTGTRGIRRLPL